MSFDVHTNSFGSKTVSIEGKNHEDFCFDGWWKHRDEDGVEVSFYIREEKHTVNIRFNEHEDTYRIHVKNYL